jgi:glycerophosphoryl diester phosphodiesterase
MLRTERDLRRPPIASSTLFLILLACASSPAQGPVYGGGAPDTVSDTVSPPACVRSLAHRGFPGYTPGSKFKVNFAKGEIQENTMAAMERAYELGFDVLEMDVTPTADDHLVLSHDTNLRRLSGVSVDISQTDLEELGAVSLGDGQGLVTVDQVFARFGSSASYDIEVKSGPFDLHSAELLVEAAWRAGVADRLTLCSFWPMVLARVEQIAPEVETSLAVTEQGVLPRVGLLLRGASRADRLALHHTMLNPALVKRLGAQGYLITAWTVDDPARIALLQSWGVDAVMTNTVTPERWPSCTTSSGDGGN